MACEMKAGQAGIGGASWKGRGLQEGESGACREGTRQESGEGGMGRRRGWHEEKGGAYEMAARPEGWCGPSGKGGRGWQEGGGGPCELSASRRVGRG